MVLAAGGCQLCNETRNGQPDCRLGMKHATVGVFGASVLRKGSPSVVPVCNCVESTKATVSWVDQSLPSDVSPV